MLKQFVEMRSIAPKSPLSIVWITAFIISSSLLASGRDDKVPKDKKDAKADEFKKTPPFPRFLETGQNLGKIVSEVIDEIYGYRTVEEYLDLSSDRAALVRSSRKGRETVYQDAKLGLAYKYKPYSCTLSKIEDLKFDGQIEDSLRIYDQNYEQKPDKVLRLFHVIGLWMYAADKEKSFEGTRFLYSGSQDAYRDLWTWSVPLEKEQLTAKFFFMPASAGGKARLELIQLESPDPKDSKKSIVKTTINIISTDNQISQREREEFLEVPVGYGCYNDELKEAEQNKAFNHMFENTNYFVREFVATNYQLNLEITATNYRPDRNTNNGQSSTVNVEIATSRVGATAMKLFRFKDSTDDFKVVKNHLSGVSFHIDMRRGDCRMSHLSQEEDKEVQDDSYSQAVILFRNDLTLDINHYLKSFDTSTGFYFVKSTKASSTSPMDRYFYEAKADEKLWFDGSETVKKNGRIVRVYTKNEDQLELMSTTVWVFDEKSENILESYHVNVVDFRPIKPGWADSARVFDISEECYLNKETMHQNKDYSWFEISYMADTIKLNALARNEPVVREMFAASMLRLLYSDFTRLPRIEISFDDDSVKFRVLVLDQAPLEYRYEPVDGKSLKTSQDNQNQDALDFAPDLEHCAKLCRLHHCTIMSYCPDTHHCATTSRPLTSDSSKTQLKEDKCTSYLLPARGASWSSLHHLLSQLHHLEYATMTMPKLPDELGGSQDSSGLSTEEFMAAADEFKKQMEEYLRQHSAQSVELVLEQVIDGHIVFMLPTKFELENDPLSDFDLNEISDPIEEADDDELEPEDDKVPAFHVGLPMTKYKLTYGGRTDRTSTSQAGENGQEEAKINMRYLTGITHDQCALACKDARCGTFSYCPSRSECTLSTAFSIGQARKALLLEQDIDCYIMERDFLNNYSKFPHVVVPQFSKAQLEDVGSASECAIRCANQSDFDCLSFEYCPKEASSLFNSDRCYLQTVRHPGMMRLAVGSESACDHYSRSYLADFNRFEYHAISAKHMDKFITNTLHGHSVFSCAEKCVTELMDCSGFQVCTTFPTTNRDSNGGINGELNGGQMRRECTMIQGRIKDSSDDRDKSKPVGVVDSKTNEVIKATDWLEYNQNCQVFSLRKNSLKAHLIDLALAGLESTREEEAEAEAKKRAHRSQGGLTFGGAVLTYLVVTLLSALVGCGYVVLRDTQSQFVRSRWDRLKIILGL